ncbi:MAG: enoyl-CoA hydratase/isomerase family protein, partial [Chloroflexi bacterium]|nr:enoyl-CoA hydratase/isomerase family protein [Chloroflexota bacterium]
MTFQHLRLDISDQIGTITLDRPEKLNALSRDLHNEMVAAASQLQADDDVRVVIVTGAGRGFCSGADLTARPRDDAPDTQNDRMDEFGWVGHQALAFGHLDKPT